MRAFLLLMIVPLLAGCADEKAPSDCDPSDPAGACFEPLLEDGTGGIRGVVVDPAVVPMEGVAVRLVGQELETKTDAEGVFTFLDLEPGFYQLEAERAGFQTGSAQTQVEAGSTGIFVRLRLVPIAGFDAFANLYQWDGFFQCAAGAQDPVVLGNLLSANVCFIINFYSGQEITQDDSSRLWFDEFVDLDRHPEWTQAETVWKSTQTLGESLRIRYQTAQPGTLGIQCGYGVHESGSPAVFAINQTEAARCGLGKVAPDGGAGGAANGFSFEFFPGFDGLPVGVALEQQFSSFVTAYYDYLPPVDWTFVSEGSVPSPP